VEVKEKQRKGESMGKTGKEKNIARGGRLRAAHGGGEERRLDGGGGAKASPQQV